MICIDLGNNERPNWWDSFIKHTFRDHVDEVLESKVWAYMVNAELNKHGGVLHRNWVKKYYYITFRQESMYMLFLLRFAQ